MTAKAKQGNTTPNIQAVTSVIVQPMTSTSTNVAVAANPVTHTSVSSNLVLDISPKSNTRKSKV